ncbi:HopJ type III effector protein [Neptuniibacter sp. CAU 1671]|uniref:HopJ type III effector protein n=1 Tax=Neptuniibacter sp. CAU 1671 TaxID=3032593 RepID=UPI0023D990BE|nr:HopJ type III effector protein [Neptuniibacter sp. CAU 1671]MDF2181107.1 HopJ type III effector protein [Neptuniibacter sp. CAU 1671]
MTPEALTDALRSGASLDFEDTINVITEHFDYTATDFKNGDVENAAGQNEGSCKIFAFAQLMGLDEETTLKCFGRFYQDVLNTPEGSDHGNIRNFMQNGWSGIQFSGTALTRKA